MPTPPHRRCQRQRTLYRRLISVCHQFLTLVPVLSKSGLCGKSTVFTYEIGFLGMLLNRRRRSSLFLKHKQSISARSESHHWTRELISSPTIPCAPQTEHSWTIAARFPGKEHKKVHGRIGAIPRPQSPSSDFLTERLAPARVRRRDPDVESL